MGINKIIYGGNTLIDLTNDTVTADTLAKGVVAHAATGEQIVGTMSGGGGEPIEVYEDADGYVVVTGTVTKGEGGDVVVDGDEISGLEVAASYIHVINVGRDTTIREANINTATATAILPQESGHIDFVFDEPIDLEEYDIFAITSSNVEYKYIGETPNAAMLEARQVSFTQLHRTPYNNNGVEGMYGRQFPNNNYTACSYYRNANGVFSNTTSTAYGVGIATFNSYTIITKMEKDSTSVVRDARHRYLVSFAFTRPQISARASTNICSVDSFSHMDYDNMNIIMKLLVYKVKRGKSINSAMLDNLWYRTPLPE